MCPSQAVEFATYGGFTWGDVMHTRCVVLWGHAPSNSNPIGFYPMILHALKNGAKLIVVDPRRIPEAEKADMWIPVRPGTDVALMLGWLRVMIEEELYDNDFVANWTIGFDDLKTAVAACTPQKVAEITWLSPEQVASSARLVVSRASGERFRVVRRFRIERQYSMPRRDGVLQYGDRRLAAFGAALPGEKRRLITDNSKFLNISASLSNSHS